MRSLAWLNQKLRAAGRETQVQLAQILPAARKKIQRHLEHVRTSPDRAARCNGIEPATTGVTKSR